MQESRWDFNEPWLASEAPTDALESLQDIPKIMDLVDTELSEPYNYYTYRYFLNDW